MKVKRESLFFKMVKDKISMKQSNHLNHTAMTFIGDVIHTVWIYGLWPLILSSGFFILFSQNWLSEEKCCMILAFIWFGYVALLFISLILLSVIEPFTSKEWRKLTVI